MEGYDYDAAASTIKIEDITSDEVNREILRKLNENDPNFDKLCVRYEEQGYRDDDDYYAEGARDTGSLGYFIGNNTVLLELHLQSGVFQCFNSNAIKTFCRGVNFNGSIQNIEFGRVDLSGGEIFQALHPFFGNNNNISKIVLQRCEFGSGCTHQLSLALRGCNKSLKSVRISDIEMGGGEQLVDIIEALSEHPQLETLRLPSMNVGRNECTALANVLSSTMAALQELNLYNNNIDDEGMDILVGAVASNSRLSVLSLSDNRNVTARGWQSLAATLESTSSMLESLHLSVNNIRDEGALIFANAMTNNRKLKTLGLDFNGITAEGWSSFSKALCDASSINKTFLSNHTLESLGGAPNIPADVASSLALNMGGGKRQVAIRKILKHHQHFDMHPFFEWDLKVWPIAINWFKRARSVVDNNNDDDDEYEDDSDENYSDESDENNDWAGIDNHKLGVIYQFIRAMPEVFEPAPAAS